MTHTLRRFHLRFAIAACIVLACAGCGGDEDDDSGSEPTATTATTSVATTPTPLPTIPRDDLPAPVERAIEVAAANAGIPASDVGLVGFTEENWTDTSLGCPDPDGMYAQVVTPGYNVVLLVNGNLREYHTDMDENVVTCTTMVQ